MDYFLQFIEDAEPKMRGPTQREWLGRIEQESINVRYAIETSAELPGLITKGLRLLTAIQRFRGGGRPF